MKIRIIKPTRIERGRPGDIVEVSPERARFLLRFGLAEPVTIREQYLMYLLFFCLKKGVLIKQFFQLPSLSFCISECGSSEYRASVMRLCA